MNRRLRTHLHSFFPSIENVVQQKQGKSKDRRYTHAKFRHFETNDPVNVRNYGVGDKWMAAAIRQQTGPVSYQCELGNNCLVKKHVDQIRPRSVSYQPKPEQPYLELEAAEPQPQQAEQYQTQPPEPASITEAESNLNTETAKVYLEESENRQNYFKQVLISGAKIMPIF